MAKNHSHGKTRLWGEHTSMLFSITLVLFLFGMLMFIEYHSYRTTHDMQERITFKVDLSPEVSDSSALALQKVIQGYDYVKQVDYISKEEAAQLFSDELGENIVEFLGYNPLYPTLMVNFKSDILPEKDKRLIDEFTQSVSQLPEITGVVFQENLVNELNSVFYTISWFLLIFIALLFFVSINLISNTMKLAIYATQNTIQTMQLVGAKDSFIARPFLRKSILIGFFGGLLSDLLLCIGVYSFSMQFGLNILTQEHWMVYGGMALLLPLTGILISYFSPFFSIKHYLKKKIR